MRSLPENQPPATLIIRGLSACYGTTPVLQHISFAVKPGEIVGILGPSGAGKTTILAALTGTTAATGTVRYGDEDLSATKPRHRRFGNVYQEFRLFDWATVFDNVAFPCRALGWSSAEIRARVDWALTRMNLRELADRQVRSLSGGQSQRVALARAIAFAPRALFLDEPFSDLDPPLRARLQADLVDFVAETRLPTILVTHDRSEAFAACDRIGVLFQGMLRQMDRPQDLLRRPCDRETAEFLGYTNSMTGTLTRIDGGNARVSVSGREWHGTLTGAAPKTSPVGRRAVALFRPAALTATVESPETTNVCALKVHSIHQMEHYLLIVAAHDPDGLWTVHWPLASPPPEPHRLVSCRLDPSDLLVFPEDEGSNG